VTAGCEVTVERMAELARVSRASYYRFDEKVGAGVDSDMDLPDAIQRIALEWPSYGRRRITQELRRRGWTANWKRVYRLMRKDNLLCVRKRKFVVTTDSNHGRKVYPNLAREMVLTDVDQLWRADITYIRLREEFVFSGCRSGCLLAPGNRLGAGPHARRRVDAERAAHGLVPASSGTGAGASFRPRLAICQQRLHRRAQKKRAFRSACRARAIHGITRRANHS
jgi:transposase InsO family protein